MTANDEYCDFCDLPLAQCVHGMPPAPKAEVTSPPKPRKRAAATKPLSVPTRAKPVNLRWTPPEALRPHILAVLEEAGGELEANELFSQLEALAEDRLRPEDSERTPEGELRWRYAARRARVALIDEGLMTKSRPGVWQLA